jgi:hypothetical protein
MTVCQVSTIGMFEANPVARVLVACTGNASALIALKILSLTIAMGMLIPLRHRWQAEVAAWVATAVLAWLTMEWTAYLRVMSEIEPQSLAALAHSEWFVVALDK